MINILVSVVENPQEFARFIESKNAKGYKFFVGIKESLAKDFVVKNKNVEIHKYKDASKKEEIINALQSCKLSEGKIMILRRVPTEDEFSMLEKSEKDIVTLKARRGKFAEALKRFMAKIIRKMFAFTYFEDISAICYGKNMYRLLSVCQNLSMTSRINKYVGLEIDEIETTSQPVKKDFTKWKTVLLFTLVTVLLVGALAGAICLFIFIEPKVLNLILIVFALLVVGLIWFIAFINLLRTLAVGNLHYGRAEEV